jgi:hypothetical protein
LKSEDPFRCKWLYANGLGAWLRWKKAWIFSGSFGRITFFLLLTSVAASGAGGCIVAKPALLDTPDAPATPTNDGHLFDRAARLAAFWLWMIMMFVPLKI